MKKYLFETLVAIVDLVFPPREEKKLFADIRPEDFCRDALHFQAEIYPGVSAILPYQDERVRSVVVTLKKERDIKAARIMAYALARFIVENGLEDSIVVPMPISRKRRRERGYNQCEVVAKLIPKFARKVAQESATADTLKEVLPEHPVKVRFDILERPVHTKKFAVRGRAERLQAIHAAQQDIFRLRPNLLNEDQRIIVIDDVTTTGATMGEALRTLREGGVHGAIGLAFAH